MGDVLSCDDGQRKQMGSLVDETSINFASVGYNTVDLLTKEKKASTHLLDGGLAGVPRTLSPTLVLQHVEQEVVPRVDGPRQAPVHAVVVHRHVLVRQVAVPAGVPVRPQQHRIRGVQQPEPDAPLPPFPLCLPELLHLRHVHLEVDAVQSRLVAAERLLPHAVPPLVPLAVLEVRRRVRPQEHRPPESFEAVENPERRPEHPPVAVVHGQVGDVRGQAVVATDELAALVEHGRPEKPVPGRHDHVVELRHLGGPVGVGLVQVQVEQASVRGTIGVGFVGPYQERRPEAGDGEVVGGEVIASELLVLSEGGIHHVRHLQMHLRRSLMVQWLRASEVA
ncbi:hypothetical protein C4D60_Mb04t05980 [Musa balbisiana]|uniref:Uncharacterized protein n=1 Tax=Musa balbisiana TaxID=52838 RepID=A0A4S8K9X1_MUSBA|nr:hypothetical protein C4D60_Mb04t05980 [Musa balbisiana]